MASLRKLPEIVHCNLEFEGVLSSALRPKLVHDTIAYLCFQRQQIPMAYNCIKADVDVIKVKLWAIIEVCACIEVNCLLVKDSDTCLDDDP